MRPGPASIRGSEDMLKGSTVGEGNAYRCGCTQAVAADLCLGTVAKFGKMGGIRRDEEKST